MTPTSDQHFTWAVSGARWGIALIFSAWLSAPFGIQALFFLMGIHVVACLLNPNTSVPARRMANIVLIVLSVHVLYGMAQGQTGLNLGILPTTPVCLFYCLGEVMAIVRTTAPYVEWPPALLEWLGKAEGISGRDRQELTALKLKQDDQSTALELKFTQRKPDDK